MKKFIKSAAAKNDDPRGTARPNPPAHILVVEDDFYVRLLNTEVLERSGYQVDTAEDGVAAWNALHTAHYDLLITDNNMPNLSGVELVKKMRAEEMTLPVIMATGALPRQELEQNPSLKIAATLLKPFTTAQLVELVKKILQLSAEARKLVSPLPG